MYESGSKNSGSQDKRAARHARQKPNHCILDQMQFLQRDPIICLENMWTMDPGQCSPGRDEVGKSNANERKHPLLPH